MDVSNTEEGEREALDFVKQLDRKVCMPPRRHLYYLVVGFAYLWLSLEGLRGLSSYLAYDNDTLSKAKQRSQ
jgi:hypothetical protein